MSKHTDIKIKVQKQMPEFTGEVDGLSAAELDARLAVLAKESQAVQDAKEGDAGLEEALATASELGAPYRDSKKAISLKTKYIITLLKEKA